MREKHFGSNFKEPSKMTPFWRLFLGALNDFMLKVLMVAAVIEIAVEVGLSDDHKRKTGK